MKVVLLRLTGLKNTNDHCWISMVKNKLGWKLGANEFQHTNDPHLFMFVSVVLKLKTLHGDHHRNESAFQIMVETELERTFAHSASPSSLIVLKIELHVVGVRMTHWVKDQWIEIHASSFYHRSWWERYDRVMKWLTSELDSCGTNWNKKMYMIQGFGPFEIFKLLGCTVTAISGQSCHTN